MKKVIFLSLAIAYAIVSKSQILYIPIPQGTTGISPSSNSGIGIGISNPISKLDVNVPADLGGLNITTKTQSFAIIGGGTTMMTTPYALKVQYTQNIYSPSTDLTVTYLDAKGHLSLGDFSAIAIDPIDFLNLRDGLAIIKEDNNFITLRPEEDGANITWFNEGGEYSDLNFIYGGANGPAASLSQTGTLKLNSEVTAPESGGVNGLEITNDGDHNDDFAIRVNTGVGTIFRVTNDGHMFLGKNLNNGANKEKYNLFVEKGIRTEKIRVDIAADNGWADFVFDKDYEMMIIEELSNFIAINGHLPNVPSAAQVEKEGIDLAEMNAVLLRQIEE